MDADARQADDRPTAGQPTSADGAGTGAALLPGDVGMVAGLPSRLILLAGRVRGHAANLTAFTGLQAASYLIPIVTIPYFARALGIAGMGRLAIAGAVALAAGVAMDYAIQLSGTRFAASHPEDGPALNRYLNATIAVKLAIIAPMVAILVMAGLLLPAVAAHFWVFFWSLISAAAGCLFPQWLFQGLLVMPLAARILVMCRVGAAAAALLMVARPGDVYVVPMTQAFGGLVALAAAARLLRRRYDIAPGRPTRGDAGALVRDNWPLFSATAWGAAYTHGGIVIMSTMLTVTSIGYYSIAQKIAQAVVAMFNVAAQTGFPVFVRARASAAFSGHVRRYMAIVVAAAAVIIVALIALRRPLYEFFAGARTDQGVDVLVVWLVASLFTIVSVSLNPIMVTLRLDTTMARVYRLIGIAFLLAAPIACASAGIVGMAGATLAAEAAMAAFCTIGVVRALRRGAGETRPA